MATTTFKHNEIIVLLGAGASVDAGIPDSNKMVIEIQKLVSGADKNWNCFKDLYRHIRSSIFYADGLDGIFGSEVSFNVERLVNVLDELRKKERHTLYPFVGAWNPKLQDVAGPGFQNVHMFRKKIIQILRSQWIALTERENASYYKKLLEFQREYGYPLRVFSLNYDLCVEEACGYDNVQRGFSGREWDWRMFDETSDDPLPIMLYKLHGSTDWQRKDGKVTYSDSPSSTSDEDADLIFGTSYKLQYVDPFLFLAYELRRWTLDVARVIVCVGYGFNDEHINGILEQSLRQSQPRKLFCVVGPGDSAKINSEQERISKRLKARSDQIIVKARRAKEFLGSDLTIDYLAKYFPPEKDLIPELPEQE